MRFNTPRLRIKEVAEEKGITLKSICDKTGIAPSTLSRINERQTSPSLETLQTIAQALDVPLVQLFASDYDYICCPYCGKPIKIVIEETGIIKNAK